MAGLEIDTARVRPESKSLSPSRQALRTGQVYNGLSKIKKGAIAPFFCRHDQRYRSVVIQSPIDIHDQQLGMRLRDAIASALTR